MKHLTVGIALVSIIVIALYYKIVEINLNLLLMNAGNIIVWIAHLSLSAVIASKLKK